MRNSIACPSGRICFLFGTDIGSPAAIRSCSLTMSTPVTISVTGCSTWTRVFISMNEKLPSWANRNSTVPAFWYFAALDAATAALPISALSSGVNAGDGASSMIF